MKQGNGKNHTGQGYKYVHSFVDNRGKRRWRYFRRGYPSQYLPDPKLPEFIKAYTAALQRPKTARVEQGYSLGRAIDDYIKSRAYTDLKESTKTGYYNMLMRLGQNYGRYNILTLDRPKIESVLSAIDSTNKRNRYLSLFRLILEQAVRSGKIKRNPARDVPRVKHRSKGYVTWSIENIKAFEACHADNPTALLAIRLLYYTGQRSSDVAKMGNQNRRGDLLTLTQTKTGTELTIPIHPRLADVLPDRDTWLLTEYGEPFSIKGFQQWFVRKSKAAGLDGLSGHGLRKALATHLADKGATPHHIQAITGHADLGQVALYTRASNKIRLAKEAMRMLD